MLRVLCSLLCIGWLLGVGWGSVGSPLPPAAVSVVGIIGVGAAGLSRRSVGRGVGVLCLAILVGGVWTDVALRGDAARREAWQAIADGPVTLGGDVVSREVHGVTARVRVGTVRRGETTAPELAGLLQVIIPAEVAVVERGRLRLTGRVDLPERQGSWPGSFDPERFFARHGVLATMRYPKVVVLAPGTSSIRARVREALHGNLQRALPEPSAGLLSALFLSYDRDLPLELREAFAASGLAHLIAISGSHIALLAAAVLVGLTAAGFSRTLASVVTLALAVAFLALVEQPASGVRSLLMAGTAYWAYAAGRRVAGVRGLLLAAALMTVVNPRILFGDVGFQLSALAMWGLLVLYPVLARPFRTRLGILSPRTLVLLTLAAEIATAPLVAYAFGRVSVVGLLTNLLAIPLFPLLLAAAFLTAVVGGVGGVGPLVATAAHVAATLFLRLGELAAAFPGAQVVVREFPAGVLGGVYGVLFLLPPLVTLWQRRRMRVPQMVSALGP